MQCLPNFAGNIKPKIVMNQLTKYLTTLLLIPLSCLTLAADDNGGNNNTVEIPIKEPAPQRPPRVPSRVCIECSYGVGYVEFTLPVECEYMEVTLEQNGVQVYYGVVTPEEPGAEIPVLSGECTVTCHTDGNQTYSGVLLF